MVSVSGFDDWLNRLVMELADKAGLSPDRYVAEAVAMRLMDDVTTNDGVHDELLAHLSNAQIPVPAQWQWPQSIITDPERLRVLYATGLLDSPAEKVYDRIVDMAAAALAAPGAAVSLVDHDRQFFVSMHGSAGQEPESRETSIQRSLCQYAVASGQPLVLADARTDPVLQHNPAVSDGSVVAYLSIPLIGEDRHAVGTLCVWDNTPRDWTSGHVTTLRDLAQLAADHIFPRAQRGQAP